MLAPVLHAGGKFGGTSSGYSVSGGLHGVGLSVVNALSEALEVTVWRDSVEHKQNYSRGKPITILTRSELPLESKGTKGTSIRFWPDKEVFTTAIEFDHSTIAGRIRELAFLNPKVTISLKKEDDDPEKSQYTEYFYAGGLKEYVSWLNIDKSPIHDVLGFRKETNGASIDVALQWCSDAYSDTMLGYANSIRTIDGGTHIEGVKASLTRTLNALAKKSKTVKEKDINLSGEHVREGLTCIVSVKIPNPEFEGQTKTRLGNPEVRKIVDQSVQEYLTEYLELHPDVLDNIVSKSLNAYKAALAAKRARELVRSKSVLKSSSLPGKLADCSSTNPEESEIFIVEGDSAGGSAKQGRDRRFQAILPLRGKILNIERKDEAAMYKNEEIQNLILGLGLGVKCSQRQLNSTIALLLDESESLHFSILRNCSLSWCLQVTISLKKEDDDPEKSQYTEYFYAGGLKEYVSWLNIDKSPIHDVLGFRKETNGASIDVALQWCSDAYSDTMLGYANSIRTIDGGTHIEGVKASLTRTLNALAKKSKTVKEKDINLSGEHVREGLTCIVSVKIPNPEFEGQTKTRLGNPEVRKIVDQSVQEYLTEYLELHPDVLDSIVSKSLNAYKAALAAKRARELVRSKSVLKSSSLPGKLADCSSTNPEESEIFIVEGDSAGGSAKQGRDRRFQAILPLRGKILNIERKDEAAMYKNEEIQNLILGLGLGVK
ncbi:hypothetical protein F2Q68_00007076, partial [Brassica cretica]